MATTNFIERVNEITALAAVTAVIQILGDLTKEPNGKRYARTVEQRRERWLQLSQLAEQQAGRTTQPAVKRKPTVAKLAAKPAPATGSIALETAAAS